MSLEHTNAIVIVPVIAGTQCPTAGILTILIVFQECTQNISQLIIVDCGDGIIVDDEEWFVFKKGSFSNVKQ